MVRWNYNLKQRPCRSSSAIIQDKAQSEIGSRQLSKRLLGMDIQFVKCPVDRLELGRFMLGQWYHTISGIHWITPMNI